MSRFLCSLLLVASVSVLNASQQPAPTASSQKNFSGTWTFAGDPEHLPLRGGAVNNPNGSLRIGPVPTRLVISQTADHLRIEEYHQPFQKNAIVEYGLNGQPVKSQFFVELDPAPCEITSKWEQDKLVSTVEVIVGGERDARRYTQTLSIGRDGFLAVQVQRVGTADSRTLFYKRAGSNPQ